MVAFELDSTGIGFWKHEDSSSQAVVLTEVNVLAEVDVLIDTLSLSEIGILAEVGVLAEVDVLEVDTLSEVSKVGILIEVLEVTLNCGNTDVTLLTQKLLSTRSRNETLELQSSAS